MDQILNLLFAECELLALQTLAQLFLADGSVAVLIEVGERGAQLGVLQVVVAVQAGGDELRVVDQPVLVRVDDLHRFCDIFLAQMNVRDLLQPVLELLNRQLPVSVHVHLAESVPQILDLVLRDTRGDE